MTRTYKQALGARGEQIAADFLQAQGYIILDRNARTPYGEIDLVALQNPSEAVEQQKAFQENPPTVVFVEVKARTTSAYGLPEEAITTQKKAHLLAAIQAYMQAHPDLPGCWRLDVLAIRFQSGHTEPEIVHFENALT